MEQTPNSPSYELLYVVLNSGLGSRALHIAKRKGISGGTILLGRGTVKNALLELLALTDVRKEIVLMAADRERSEIVLQTLNQELKLYKPNHGIAYSIPMTEICGSRSCRYHKFDGPEENHKTMYQSITIIVDKGKGEAVVEAASKAGSRGATILNARGSGIHETSRLFNMEIEPEKEIVLIISDQRHTDEIVASIRENFQIDKPGNGIIFVQNVSQVYGLLAD